MSKKLNAEQTGESVVVAVRLPPNLLAGLDRVVEQSARPPLSSPTRSEVARGLIEMALGSLGALEAAAKPVAAPPKPVANPTLPKAPAPARQPTLPVVAPAKQTLEQAVIAALKAVEAPGIGGELAMDLAAVVRALEAQGHQREAINAELLRLGTAGVLELMPDSGNPNERKEDRAIVPRAPNLPDGRPGDPLLTATWKARPVDPPTARTYTDEQLLARLKAFQDRTEKTEREVADGAGIGKDTLNRWTNGKTKNGLKPRDKAKLIAYLDAQEGIA